MFYCYFKMLVQVIELSVSCMYYPPAGPITKLQWVKQTLKLFNENFVSHSKVFIMIEVKANWLLITEQH